MANTDPSYFYDAENGNDSESSWHSYVQVVHITSTSSSSVWACAVRLAIRMWVLLN